MRTQTLELVRQVPSVTAPSGGPRLGPGASSSLSALLLLVRPEQLKQSTGRPPAPRASSGEVGARQGLGAPAVGGKSGSLGTGAPHTGVRQMPERPACRLPLYTRYSKHRGRNKHSLLSLLGNSCLTNCFPWESTQAYGRTHNN